MTQRRRPTHNYYVPGEPDDGRMDEITLSPAGRRGNHSKRVRVRNKKKMKKWQIVLIVIVALCAIGTLVDAPTPEIPAYQIVTQENNFIRNGIQGYSYRVIVDPTLSEGQLEQIFKDVARNDSSTMHNVFFYSSQAAVDFGMYDVAQISDESGAPVISVVPEEQRQAYQAYY